MTLRIVAACALAACAPPPDAAAPVTPVIVSAARKPAPDLPPPATPLEQLARILEARDLETLVIARVDRPCRGDSDARLISAPGASCVAGGLTRCIAYAGTDPTQLEDALCARPAPAIPTPAWADALAELVHDEGAWAVTPIPGAGPALRVRIDLPPTAATIPNGQYVLARLHDRWRISAEPLVDFADISTIGRALDTTLVTGSPSIAVVTSWRDGGSEMGVEIDTLHVLCDAPAGLRVCGTMDIGKLAWVLPAEDRRRYPGAASSLRARPHVEVELEPSVRFPDRLVLTIARSTVPADRSAWEADTLAELDALRASAGEWRFVAGKLAR